MHKQITIEFLQDIPIGTAFNLITKILPQVETECKRRCNRIKTFYVSNHEINIRYEKEKLTFFISRKKLSKAIGGNN